MNLSAIPTHLYSSFIERAQPLGQKLGNNFEGVKKFAQSKFKSFEDFYHANNLTPFLMACALLYYTKPTVYCTILLEKKSIGLNGIFGLKELSTSDLIMSTKRIFEIIASTAQGTEILFATDSIFRLTFIGSAGIRFLATPFLKKAVQEYTQGNLRDNFDNINKINPANIKIMLFGMIMSIFGRARDHQMAKNSTLFTTAYAGMLTGGLSAEAFGHITNSANSTFITARNKFLTYRIGNFAARTLGGIANSAHSTFIVAREKANNCYLHFRPAPAVIFEPEVRRDIPAANNEPFTFIGTLKKAGGFLTLILSPKKIKALFIRKQDLAQPFVAGIGDFVKKEHKKIIASSLTWLFTACLGPSSLVVIIMSGRGKASRRLFTPIMMLSASFQLIRNYTNEISEKALTIDLKRIGSYQGVAINSLGIVAHVVRRFTTNPIVPHALPLFTAAYTGKLLADAAILGSRKISSILYPPIEAAAA